MALSRIAVLFYVSACLLGSRDIHAQRGCDSRDSYKLQSRIQEGKTLWAWNVEGETPLIYSYQPNNDHWNEVSLPEDFGALSQKRSPSYIIGDKRLALGSTGNNLIAVLLNSSVDGKSYTVSTARYSEDSPVWSKAAIAELPNEGDAQKSYSNIQACWLNPATGWVLLLSDASGGRVGFSMFSTTDGGKTWLYKPAPAGISFPQLCFEDSIHGWLLSDTPNVGAPRIFRTSDAGRTWISSYQTPSQSFPLKSPLSTHVALRSGPTRLPSGHLFLLADLESPTASSTEVLYQSVNDGETWHEAGDVTGTYALVDNARKVIYVTSGDSPTRGRAWLRLAREERLQISDNEVLKMPKNTPCVLFIADSNTVAKNSCANP